MAEQHVHKKGDLQNCELSFEDNDNFQKTIRFGDESLRSELYKDIERINGRIEERRKDNIYAAARSKMGGGKSEDYEEAIELLQSIPGWKDAEKQVYVCQRTIEEIREKEEIARLDTERKLAIAAQKAAVMKKRILTATVVTLFLGVALVLVLTKIVKPYALRNWETTRTPKHAASSYGTRIARLMILLVSAQSMQSDCGQTVLLPPQAIMSMGNAMLINGMISWPYRRESCTP